MDLLSELLNHAEWKNDLLWKVIHYEHWGYKFPCDRSGGFHIITQGTCYLRFEKKIIRLDKGDAVFIFKGFDHELVSTPGGKAVALQTLQKKVAISKPKKEKTVTALVSVRYEVPDGPQHPFFDELPKMILIRASEIPVGHAIHTTIEMISREIQAGTGSQLITQRLTDILLYYSIRRWLESSQPSNAGWAQAFKDEKILVVLELIHRDILFSWSIESLARSIGLSRASFAARFKNALGLTVMEYIARFRLERGRKLATNPDISLEEVSRHVGYSSAFAFSKAYKRVFGHSPRDPKSISNQAMIS